MLQKQEKMYKKTNYVQVVLIYKYFLLIKLLFFLL